MSPAIGDNGSGAGVLSAFEAARQCPTCDIPGRMTEIELALLRLDKDQGTLLAEVRSLRMAIRDSDMRGTDRHVELREILERLRDQIEAKIEAKFNAILTKISEAIPP
jgi:hypothetical protein